MLLLIIRGREKSVALGKKDTPPPGMHEVGEEIRHRWITRTPTDDLTEIFR
jgi:hypothetical protein